MEYINLIYIERQKKLCFMPDCHLQLLPSENIGKPTMVCFHIIVYYFVTFEPEGIEEWHDKIHRFCRPNMLKLFMHSSKT